MIHYGLTKGFTSMVRYEGGLHTQRLQGVEVVINPNSLNSKFNP